MATIVIPPSLSPMNLGKLNKALDKQYRFGNHTVMSLRGWIENGSNIIGKHVNEQVYSDHRVNLEYKKFATPKLHYSIDFSDGTILDVPKCVYDVVNIEPVVSLQPYTFAEKQAAIEKKLAGTGVEWLAEVDFENWEVAYQWLMDASMAEIFNFSPVIASGHWDNTFPERSR